MIELTGFYWVYAKIFELYIAIDFKVFGFLSSKVSTNLIR